MSLESAPGKDSLQNAIDDLLFRSRYNRLKRSCVKDRSLNRLH